MAADRKILQQMRNAPHDIRFEDLVKVCDSTFGAPQQSATSHRVYKMPWPGDPRVNIQPGKDGLARAYQVKQVLAAITRLQEIIGDDARPAGRQAVLGPVSDARAARASPQAGA